MKKNLLLFLLLSLGISLFSCSKIDEQGSITGTGELSSPYTTPYGEQSTPPIGTTSNDTVSDSSPAVVQGIIEPNNAEEFGPDDCVLSGFPILYMEKAELEETLGEPVKVDTLYYEPIDQTCYHYFYEFGVIFLEPINDDVYIASSLAVYEQNYTGEGPRNIKIGDSVNDVLEKFLYTDCDDDFVLEANNRRKMIYGDIDGNFGAIVYTYYGKVSEIDYKYGNGDKFSAGTYSLNFHFEDEKLYSFEFGTNP